MICGRNIFSMTKICKPAQLYNLSFDQSLIFLMTNFLKGLIDLKKTLETSLVVSSSPWKPVSIFWIYTLHEFITWAGRLHTNLNGISQKGSAHNPLWGFLYLAFYHRAALHWSAFVSSQSDPRVLTLLPCQLQLQPMLYRFPTMFFNITKHAASHSLSFVFTTIWT